MEDLVDKFISEQLLEDTVMAKILTGGFKKPQYEQMYQDFIETFLTNIQRAKIPLATENKIVRLNNRDLITPAEAIAKHHSVENKAIRSIAFVQKDLKKTKQANLVEIQVPQNQKFLVQRIEGKGKLLTSNMSFDLLQKLVDLYVKEDKAQKRSFQKLFRKFIRKKIKETVLDKSQKNRMQKPFNFKMKGKVYSYLQEPMERTYIKKALSKIEQEMDLEIDQNSDDIFLS